MRILLWHGYLLGGTGSNVYTRQLARAWMQAGHDVTVFCQDPRPEEYDLGGARVVRPDVGGLLPVFVLDRYEGYEVKLVGDCRAEELDRWVEANARAIVEHLPADVVFCNHVLLGGPVGVASGARFAVKAHGSELEYAMRGNPALAAWGLDGLRQAAATFVGSPHVRRVLEEVCGHVDRVHEVPPGVDVDAWRPAERASALAALLAEAQARSPEPGRTPRSGVQTRGTPSASAGSSGPTGRPSSTSGSSSATRECTCSSRRSTALTPARSSSASGSSERSWSGVRARTSSSPARSSTGTWSTCSPSPTRALSRRSSRRRSGWSPPKPLRDRVPAARRAPLRARRDRRRARGGVPAGSCATSPASPRATWPIFARSSPSSSPSARPIGRPFVRRRAGPRWSGGAGRASPVACSSLSLAEHGAARAGHRNDPCAGAARGPAGRPGGSSAGDRRRGRPPAGCVFPPDSLRLARA